LFLFRLPLPVPPPIITAIALGSNLGDRLAHINAGLAAVRETVGVRLIARSNIIETAALVAPGHPPGPPYLNSVVLVETTLPPLDLLANLLDIERRLGRDRSGAPRWSARTLDLDLLFYGDLVLDEPGLTVPHKEMHRRRFVLEPLAQVAPGWRHPLLGLTTTEMLAAL
jgi:2-amino-4-hydroxy-6-hydroxymethyldihydropteridine diphosphokinase